MPSLRIIIYANRGHTDQRYQAAVSGHVQVPLAVSNELHRLGHKVCFVTPEPQKTDDMMAILSDTIETELLCNPTPRHRTGGLVPLRFIRHLVQLYALLRRNRSTVVHFFGMKRIGLLCGALSGWPCCFKTIYTPVHYASPFHDPVRAWAERWLLGRIDRILPTSDHIARMLTQIGVHVDAVLRPGVVRDLSGEVAWQASHRGVSRRSVLFWRDATHQNGVDVAVEVFRQLAQAYPNMDFVFAIRFEDQTAKNMYALAAERENVKVLRFPYPQGVNMAYLLQNAVCVLMPMRELSVQPQFAILESMMAGVPVVASNVESNAELIDSGVTGFLFEPEDSVAAANAVKALIDNQELGRAISRVAQADVRKRYNYPRLARRLEHIYADMMRNAGLRRRAKYELDES